MRIEYSKRSQKSLTDIPIKMQVKIAKAIEGLTQNPPKGDIKTLEGFSDGRKRLRVGQYRVVYKYLDDGTIFVYVINIGVREDIYKGRKE